MIQFFNKNCKKIIEKLPQQFSLSLSKSFIILGLLIYWGVIFAGTLLQIN